MSEQDNTLPPGWAAETIKAAGANVIEAYDCDSPVEIVEITFSSMAALLRKAYEQGRREIEEAVGAGGVNSAFTLALRETAKWFPNGMADEALKRSNP